MCPPAALASITQNSSSFYHLFHKDFPLFFINYYDFHIRRNPNIYLMKLFTLESFKNSQSTMEGISFDK